MDGFLSVKQAMNFKDPSSILTYTLLENTPKIFDRELQPEQDDHYRGLSHIWLHSAEILDQRWTFSFKSVLGRVQQANRNALTGAAIDFEDMTGMMFTRPKSTHDNAPTVCFEGV